MPPLRVARGEDDKALDGQKLGEMRREGVTHPASEAIVGSHAGLALDRELTVVPTGLSHHHLQTTATTVRPPTRRSHR